MGHRQTRAKTIKYMWPCPVVPGLQTLILFYFLQYSGDVNQAWVYKNDVKIEETELYTYYVNSVDNQYGYVKSMGSR